MGDQEAGLGAFLFEQRVGADGGAVAKKRNVARRHALIDQFFDAVQDRLKRFFRRRRNFRDGDLARVFVKKNKIGKRSAGVYGNSILGHSLFRLPLNFGLQFTPAVSDVNRHSTPGVA